MLYLAACFQFRSVDPHEILVVTVTVQVYIAPLPYVGVGEEPDTLFSSSFPHFKKPLPRICHDLGAMTLARDAFFFMEGKVSAGLVVEGRGESESHLHVISITWEPLRNLEIVFAEDK